LFAVIIIEMCREIREFRDGLASSRCVEAASIIARETISCKRGCPSTNISPHMLPQGWPSAATGASIALLQLRGESPGGGTCSGIDRWRTIRIPGRTDRFFESYGRIQFIFGPIDRHACSSSWLE
jgi:hypothetical protein